MQEGNFQFNDCGEIFCLSCPIFNRNDRTCPQKLSGGDCPTKADFEPIAPY